MSDLIAAPEVPEGQPPVNPSESQVPPASPEGAGVEPPPSAPPVETPTPDVETPVQVPTLPGQMTPETELAWLRQYSQQLANQLRQTQTNLQEYEVAGLSDEERYAQQIQQYSQYLQQQQEELQAAQARQQWASYYKSWVPDQPSLVVGDDPIDWQHNVLTHLYSQNQKLQKELATLRKAATQPSVPKITSPTPGPTHRKTMSQLTLQEVEAMKERALWGQLTPEDMPLIG